MKDFFASVYEVFRSVYGDNLSSYLYGLCNTKSGDLYTQTGLILIIVGLISCLLFYRVFGNSNFYKVKHWLIPMFTGALLTGLIAVWLPLSKKNAGLVCSQFSFSNQDAIFFGIINFFLALAIYFVFSLGMRYLGKKAVRYTPF